MACPHRPCFLGWGPRWDEWPEVGPSSGQHVSGTFCVPELRFEGLGRPAPPAGSPPRPLLPCQAVLTLSPIHVTNALGKRVTLAPCHLTGNEFAQWNQKWATSVTMRRASISAGGTSPASQIAPEPAPSCDTRQPAHHNGTSEVMGVFSRAMKASISQRWPRFGETVTRETRADEKRAWSASHGVWHLVGARERDVSFLTQTNRSELAVAPDDGGCVRLAGRTLRPVSAWGVGHVSKGSFRP